MLAMHPNLSLLCAEKLKLALARCLPKMFHKMTFKEDPQRREEEEKCEGKQAQMSKHSRLRFKFPAAGAGVLADPDGRQFDRERVEERVERPDGLLKVAVLYDPSDELQFAAQIAKVVRVKGRVCQEVK